MELSGANKKILRGKAQIIEPCVLIGKSGITDGVIAAIEQALAKDQLVKIRFTQVDSSVEERCAIILERTGCSLISTLGKTAALYRANT